MKPSSEIIIYDAGQARVEVRLDQETVWLTQEQMAQLFGRERSVITKHVRNVFAEGELEAPCRFVWNTTLTMLPWLLSPVGMCAGRWPACAHVHEACLIRRMSPWALP